MYFEVKVKYDKTMENGLEKTVTEVYLVDAVSFTEAEARIVEEMLPYHSYLHPFSVSAVKKVKISEVVWKEEADYNYRFKYNIITFDEKTMVEKRTPINIIVQADDIDEAFSRFKESMKGSISDYTISEIKETQILTIYKSKINE